MKNFFLVPVLLLTFILSGCFSDPVQDDLLVYLNEELADISHLENEALTAYESVTGPNYTSDQELYETLTFQVIPAYQEFADKLEDIKVETEELREIHEGYIDGVNLQYNAFVTVVTALDELDPGKIEEANAMLNEARTLMRDFNDNIEQLAEEHDVRLTEPVDDFTL
ncbi:hypothetical protein [Bacillus sp. V3B]|uniref:hypothetical protein n=1 Tax=Bacillus sp. V3B TaxID=2804915 RepID=UPI00210C7B96|nr:hypothetical protein [Bacillus sp. V3B]